MSRKVEDYLVCIVLLIVFFVLAGCVSVQKDIIEAQVYSRHCESVTLFGVGVRDGGGGVKAMQRIHFN